MLSQTQIKTLSQLGLPNWKLRLASETQTKSYYRLQQLMFCCASSFAVNKPLWAQDLMAAVNASFVTLSATAAAHWSEQMTVTLEASECTHQGSLSAEKKRAIWMALADASSHDG